MKNGKHLDGRQITDEEMRDYEIAVKRHNNWCDKKLEDMNLILDHVEKIGIAQTKEVYTKIVEEIRSMDAPNKPGYYRANND